MFVVKAFKNSTMIGQEGSFVYYFYQQEYYDTHAATFTFLYLFWVLWEKSNIYFHEQN